MSVHSMSADLRHNDSLMKFGMEGFRMPVLMVLMVLIVLLRLWTVHGMSSTPMDCFEPGGQRVMGKG